MGAGRDVGEYGDRWGRLVNTGKLAIFFIQLHVIPCIILIPIVLCVLCAVLYALLCIVLRGLLCSLGCHPLDLRCDLLCTLLRAFLCTGLLIVLCALLLLVPIPQDTSNLSL